MPFFNLDFIFYNSYTPYAFTMQLGFISHTDSVLIFLRFFVSHTVFLFQVPQVSTVTITPSSPSVAKGGELTLTCTAHAYPGFLSLNWKNETNVISTKDIYEVGSVTVSNDARTYHVSSTLKLTATESYVATAFQTCSVTDQSQGLVQCKHTYDCSASYDSLPSSLKSSPIEVTVTGLQGLFVKIYSFYLE